MVDDPVCSREAWLHAGDAARWVRQHERNAGVRPGLSTDERARLKDLERENRELKRANEILKLASAFFVRELDPRHP